MTLVDTLLPEFDREAGLTRQLLAAVPDDKFAWAPHESSLPLGVLAAHLAALPGWLEDAMTREGAELPVPTPDGDTPPATRAAVLARFDKSVDRGRRALAGRTDAELMAPLRIHNGGKPLVTMPRAGVIRHLVMNHLVHHRGQLSVYLRMQGVAVPSMYGPSRDPAS